MLSLAERHRYETTVAHRRDTFLTGRWMLRRLVSQLTGVAPAEVPLTAACPDWGAEHGRPHLPGSRLHLSLTHGANVVVAAASWDKTVGVDVEPLVQPSGALAAIGALTGDASLRRWTRVEAVLKADGRGLRVDPARVVFEGDIGRVVDAPERYRVSEVDLAPDVRASVAVAL
jgi:4'-phosphopantetheinyl transferase